MSSVQALFDAARTHLNAGRFTEADRVCREILKLDNRQAETMQVLALSLFQRREYEQAIEWLRKAIRIRPDRHQFYSILGIVCAKAGRREDAARYHQRSVELEPRNADYRSNLGLALWELHDYPAAAESCREALRLNPNHDIAATHLGLALKSMGDLNAAMAEFNRAVRIEPRRPEYWAHLLMPALYSQTSPEEIAARHRQWAAQWADPLERIMPPPRRFASPGEKVRIGYVSADFHRHSVMYFFAPILTHHDREQFEIFCYRASPDHDAMTDRLREFGDTWRDIDAVSDRDAVETIRRDRIDILIDLSGHTRGNRLLVFAYRPALVQMTYMGYAATTGMRQIDFFITDSVLDQPEDEKRYAETLLPLPHGFSCYEPPADSSEISSSRVDAPITFISLHPLIRLNDQVIELWAKILLRLPKSRLLIVRDALDAPTQARLRERFAKCGVDVSQLDLRQHKPGMQHLQLYAEAHIALDTFPWSGHTTACEALWMGCPVITLYGQAHVGRLVSSVLTQLQLPELIARSPEEYVQIAMNLAADQSRRAELRSHLRHRMRHSPLMDGGGFTRDLESAYRSALNAKSASQ